MCTCFVLRIDRRKISTSSVSIFALSLVFLEIVFSDLCDIRSEWTKMQTQQFRVFSSEPFELAVSKE